MKRNLLILILALPIFIWQGVKGQEYQTVIKPDTSIWLVAHNQLYGSFVDTLFAKNKQGDYTEIWFKPCYGDPFCENLYYFGKFKASSDNSKLWYVAPGDSIENIIFDLDLQVGDTFYYKVSIYDQYLIVDSVYYLNNLKHIEFTPELVNWNNQKVSFIEGIGPNISLFYACFGCGILNPFVACKHELDSLVYITQNENFNGCNLSTQIQDKDLEFLIDIYPNPFDTEFHVYMKDEQNIHVSYIEIFDIVGKKVNFNSFVSSNNSLTISIEDNPPGVLFLVIHTREHKKIIKKIVKL